MQPSTLISTVPNGAPAGSAITSTGAGAARCSSRSASRITSRLPPTGQKARRTRRGCRRRDRAQRLAERIRDHRFRWWRRGPSPKPSPARIGSASAIVLRKPGDVVARLRAQQQAHRRRAIGERGGDGFEADLRHFVDGERQHVRRQAIAEARERVDQRRAVRVVVHAARPACVAAGLAIGAEQHRAACASAHRPAAARKRQRRSGTRRRIVRSRRRYRRRSRRDRRRARWRRSGRDRGSGVQPTIREREWAQRSSVKVM